MSNPSQNTSTPESESNVEINPLPPPPHEFAASSSASLDSHPQILQETLNDLGKDMFEKVTAYFHGELDVAAEDYAVLEKMNRATATKYVEMKTTGSNIAKALNELNEKYAAIAPQLDQIDQVEAGVGQLEEAAHRLDAYSKALEQRWKTYEKQQNQPR